MPGVRAFGRRWQVASDDFVYPFLFELIIRVLWLITVISIVTAHPEESFTCSNGSEFKLFFYGLIGFSSFLSILSLIILCCSAQGGIMAVHKRKPVVPLLYIKLLLFVPELAFTIIGVYWAFYTEKDSKRQCTAELVYAVRGVTLTGLIMAVITIVSIFILFDPLGASKETMHNVSTSHAIWESRCRWLCCDCIPCHRHSNTVGSTSGREQYEAYTGIAELLADYFKDVDLVPSDLAAGLLVLQQSQTPLKVPELPHTHTPICDEPTSEAESWLCLDKIRLFMRFAAACYGWPLYCLKHPLTGCCRLCHRSCTGECGQCCKHHEAAILNTTNLPGPKSLLYVSKHNALFEPSFYVAVFIDEDNSSTIVVSVRGTLSLQDALTDMYATTATLDEHQPGLLCHSGILRSASYVRDRLLDGGESSVLRMAMHQYPESRLVLCGHSLGAGVASLLSMLLQPTFPHLRCYAYSPPLGLLNGAAAEISRHFICSIALGYDLVPRLSLTTMKVLKRRLLTELNTNYRPKYAILASSMWRACCPFLCSCESETERGRSSESLITQDQLNEGRYNTLDTQDAEEQIEFSDGILAQQPDMTFAGRMLFIHELEHLATSSGCCRKLERRFAASWTNDSYFTDIVIDQRMLTDHLPHKVQSALDHLVDTGYQLPIVNF